MLEYVLLVGCVRRELQEHDEPLQPIRSLRYFVPIVEELRHEPVDAGYVRYLRSKLSERLRPKPTRTKRQRGGTNRQLHQLLLVRQHRRDSDQLLEKWFKRQRATDEPYIGSRTSYAPNLVPTLNPMSAHSARLFRPQTWIRDSIPEARYPRQESPTTVCVWVLERGAPCRTIQIVTDGVSYLMRNTSALPLVVAYANQAAAVCAGSEVRLRNFFELDPIFDNGCVRKIWGGSTDTLEVRRPPSLELSPVLRELCLI